jgi:hypothetical protein
MSPRTIRLIEFAARSVATAGIIWTMHDYGVAAGAAAFLVGLGAFVAGLVGADR